MRERIAEAEAEVDVEVEYWMEVFVVEITKLLFWICLEEREVFYGL